MNTDTLNIIIIAIIIFSMLAIIWFCNVAGRKKETDGEILYEEE